MNRYQQGLARRKVDVRERTMAQAEAERRKREETTKLPSGRTHFANGDVLCPAHSDRIDPSVCTVRSFRRPDRCNGCQHKEGHGRQDPGYRS